MKDSSRSFTLKMIALVTVYSTLMPASLVLQDLLFDGSIDILLLALPFVSIAAGFVTSILIVRDSSKFIEKVFSGRFFEFILFYLNKKINVRSITTTLAYFFMIIPVSFTVLALAGAGILQKVLMAVLSAVFYFYGVKTGINTFDRYVKTGIAIAGGIYLTVLLLLTSVLGNFENIRAAVFLFAYISLVCVLIIRNQSCIDRNLVRKRGKEGLGLPGKIRSFNTLMIFGLFTLIIVLFYFNGIVAYLLKLLGGVVLFILLLIMKLYSLLLSPGEMAPEAGPPAGPPDFAQGTAYINPYFNFFVNVLTNFVILYFGYYILKLLWRLLKKLLSKLSKLFSDHSADSMAGNGDYADEIDSISHDHDREYKKIRSRKTASDFRKTADPVLKVRLAYRSALLFLEKLGLPVESSDTPGEILSEARKHKGTEDMSYITKVYEEVRYGDIIPETTEVDAFINAYDRLTSSGKRPV